MMKIIKFLVVSIVLFNSFLSIAEDTLNNIVKSQQNLEKTGRQESKVKKEDVFSKVENATVSNLNFPVEKNCYKINDLIIENDFLHDENIKKIKKEIIGQCLGVQGINKAATILQDYLIKSGFVTTRVNIPDQDLASNTLKFNVLAGRIEKITIVNRDIKEWILPFKRGEILNIKDLDQGLEVLQKNPNTKIRINIKPGNKLGFSEVVIDTGRGRSWDLRAWANNWGDKGTGRNLLGGVGYFYNLTKMNDVFYLSGTTNIEHVSGGYHSLSAYYSIPMGYWDYEIFYSSSRSSQALILNPFKFNYSGESKYLSLKASRVVFRDQNKKMSFFSELLHRKVSYKLEDEELKLQKRDMSNLRIGVNFKRNMPGALLDTTLSYQRFVTWFGGKKTPDMQSGDVSQNSDIFALNGNYTRWLNLPYVDSYYEMYFGGQYSPSTLTLQDQLTIGDRTNVRGFENSSGIYGDNGFYIQNTVNVITGYHDIEWYLGNDYGVLFHHHTEKESSTLVGATTGIKGHLGSMGYDFSLSTPIAHPHIIQTDDFIISFNLNYQI